MGGKKSFKLTGIAATSIFVFTKETKIRLSSCEQSEKRLKRDIVDEVFSTESADIPIEMDAQIKIPNTRYISMCTQTDDESMANESGSDNEYNSNESENEYHEVENINRKYILVDWENLKSLLKYCLICATDAVVKKVSTRGSIVKVHLDCIH